jgi:hypothetical protein
MERFDKKMGDRAIQNLIIRDAKDGQQVGVRGVPPLFLLKESASRIGASRASSR